MAHLEPTSGSLDTYWRLPTYEDVDVGESTERLHDAGYYQVHSGTVRAVLVRKAHRIDRGLLCYDVCDTEELVKFAVNRGVLAKDRQAERQSVMNQLRHADATLCFHSFTTLPPELRCRIYEYYIAGFPQELKAPIQPPLARTCKVLRKELLPVFYGDITFIIEFEVPINHFFSLRATIGTTYFLETTNAENLADIRKLSTYVPGIFTVDITLGNDEVCYSISIRAFGCAGHDEENGRQKKKAVREKLGAVLKMVVSRKGKLGFTVENFYRLRRAAEAAFE